MKTNLTKKQSFSILVVIIIGALLGALILFMESPAAAGDEHGDSARAEHADHSTEEKSEDKHADADEGGLGQHDEHEKPQAQGPHGGKLFTEGDFGLEVLLAEDGGEPRFRVYLFNKAEPLPADAAKVSITLARPSGENHEIGFKPEKDYLVSDAVIAEPHVFEARIAAQTGTTKYLFTFAQEEGKIAMSDEQLAAAGITINTAGPAEVSSSLTLPGEIRYNEDKTAHVVPRLAGVVESVPANLGQQVKKGQVLAVIASSELSERRSELLAAQQRLVLAKTTFEREKKLWQEKISAEQDYLQAQQAMKEAEIAVRNLQQKLVALGATSTIKVGSLNRYEIRAPFEGTVMEKHISLGEAVKEDANIFTISDLSSVWAEVAVPAKDLNTVRVGEKVTVKAIAFGAEATGTISYVGSLLGEQTRTAKARVVLANPDMSWRPGLFVSVEIVSNQTEVPVAVTTEAVQTVDEKPTIFIRVPDGFLPQQVVLGRSDGKVVEVVKGLKAGTKYASAGSFIIKSELGKASATHSH